MIYLLIIISLLIIVIVSLFFTISVGFFSGESANIVVLPFHNDKFSDCGYSQRLLFGL